MVTNFKCVYVYIRHFIFSVFVHIRNRHCWQMDDFKLAKKVRRCIQAAAKVVETHQRRLSNEELLSISHTVAPSDTGTIYAYTYNIIYIFCDDTKPLNK
jgi:hypothetical protein